MLHGGRDAININSGSNNNNDSHIVLHVMIIHITSIVEDEPEDAPQNAPEATNAATPEAQASIMLVCQPYRFFSISF